MTLLDRGLDHETGTASVPRSRRRPDCSLIETTDACAAAAARRAGLQRRMSSGQ